MQRMTAQEINAALDIQESYQMPDALMKKITGPAADAERRTDDKTNKSSSC